jgi:hypothetical protein
MTTSTQLHQDTSTTPTGNAARCDITTVLITDSKRLREDASASTSDTVSSGTNNGVIVGDVVSHVVTSSVTTSRATTPASSDIIVSPLEDINILGKILSFIGRSQYLYVALVNHNFQAAYVQMFPDIKLPNAHLLSFDEQLKFQRSPHRCKETHYNASTVPCAKFCYIECVVGKPDTQWAEDAMWQSAAKHGCLEVMQYLLSVIPVHRKWSRDVCATIAKHGHLHILQMGARKWLSVG